MHDVWDGSSTVDAGYCGNYFCCAGTASEKNLLYNYYCTAVCGWAGSGGLHGIDDAFCGCGAEPAACVAVQNHGKIEDTGNLLGFVSVIRPLTRKQNNPSCSIRCDDMNTPDYFFEEI